MYERMLEKSKEPETDAIREYMGEESYTRLLRMKDVLEEKYHLATALRFPFGKDSGWGYKFAHRSLHLCYALFEKGAFTVWFNISDKQAPGVENILGTLLPGGRQLWENRYPCGEHGGWFEYRVLSDEDLEDVLKIIYGKRPPAVMK